MISLDLKIKKLKELNDEINELKDQIHVILYILKSTDERMFADLEYDMINAISNQNNSKLLYVLTHSSIKTNKEEIIDMINVGIKSVLEKNKNVNFYNIFLKMRANEDNCFFVNFHENENKPICGIGELFNEITLIAKQTNTYKKYTKQNMSNDEFKELIREEADIRRKKAEKILLYHSIGAGAIGAIPGVDLAVQKCVIQKNATKKIGQIFGLDINLISKEKEPSNIKNANNDNNFKIMKELPSIIPSLIGNSLNYISNFAQIPGEIALAALRGVSISFIFIGTAIGIGIGYYFTYKHCQQLIDILYNYFLENIDILSDSLIQAVKYLEFRTDFHLKNEFK